MKRSEYILAKGCGIICVIGGITAFILFAVKGVPHIMSLLFAVFMFFLGIALLLVTPKPTIPRSTEERLDEEEKLAELKRIVEERKGKEAVDYDKVLIAHYDTGNVNDPLGILHDEQGRPILLNGEKNLHTVGSIFFHAHKWRINKFFQASTMTTFSDAGAGYVYITNNRLIYLREPSPTKQLSEGGPLGAPKYIPLAAQAKEWLEKGRLEGLSIPLKNIEKLVTKGTLRKKICVDVIEGEYVYKIFIRPIEYLDSILLSIKGGNLNALKELSNISNRIAQCPYCQSTFQITPTKRPFKVKCPNCGKKSMLK